jgi:hypothetical protein
VRYRGRGEMKQPDRNNKNKKSDTTAKSLPIHNLRSGTPSSKHLRLITSNKT